MKHLHLVILLLLTTPSLFAQLPPRDSLIGTWICTKTAYMDVKIPDNEKQFMEMARQAMVGCTFQFLNDGQFNLIFPGKGTEFRDMEVKNKPWTLDIAKNMIHVGGKENILSIFIKTEQNLTVFVMEDFPVLLLVEKKR